MILNIGQRVQQRKMLFVSSARIREGRIGTIITYHAHPWKGRKYKVWFDSEPTAVWVKDSHLEIS